VTGTRVSCPHTPEQPRLVVRTEQRYAAIQELRAAGHSIARISRGLQLERNTVRRSSARRTSTICWPRQGRAGRCSTASSPTCIGGGTRAALEAARLFAEIRDAGYRGSALTVRRYLHPFRATLTAPERPPTQLKVRDVVGWIMREPGKLNDDEQNRLQALLDRCPELNALAGHVRAFAEMIRDLRSRAVADEQPEEPCLGCEGGAVVAPEGLEAAGGGAGSRARGACDCGRHCRRWPGVARGG
jgi:hypothetical protein